MRLGLALALVILGSSGSASTAAGTKARVPALLTPDMLGAQVNYFEAKVGPAWRVSDHTRTYKMGTCEVEVQEKDGTIIALSIEHVSSLCSMDLSKFVNVVRGKSLPPLNTMTFGAFEDATGRFGVSYTADCLELCGNAYDPSVYLTRTGSHAENFVDVRIGVALVDDKSISASVEWGDLMKKARGGDYVVDLKFNCDHHFDDKATILFREIKITSVEVGAVEDGASCSKH